MFECRQWQGLHNALIADTSSALDCSLNERKRYTKNGTYSTLHIDANNVERLDQVYPREEEWVMFKFSVHLVALITCWGEVSLLSNLMPPWKPLIKAKVSYWSWTDSTVELSEWTVFHVLIGLLELLTEMFTLVCNMHLGNRNKLGKFLNVFVFLSMYL